MIDTWILLSIRKKKPLLLCGIPYNYNILIHYVEKSKFHFIKHLRNSNFIRKYTPISYRVGNGKKTFVYSIILVNSFIKSVMLNAFSKSVYTEDYTELLLSLSLKNIIRLNIIIRILFIVKRIERATMLFL